VHGRRRTEKLKAGDFVHAVNGVPVTAEEAATQLASKTGDRLKLKLRSPPGASTVYFDKASAEQESGIDLMFDAPSGRVRVEKMAAPGLCFLNELGDVRGLKCSCAFSAFCIFERAI